MIVVNAACDDDEAEEYGSDPVASKFESMVALMDGISPAHDNDGTMRVCVSMEPERKPPASPTTAEFGRRVRERRLELGLSLEALADKAGMHWSMLGRLERGASAPSLASVLRIASALGVDAGTLVSGLPVPD